MRINEVVTVIEKAKSKAQQRFMGMVHAMQKDEKIKGASKELKQAAKEMPKKAAKDYAKTKHKGLPAKVKEEYMGWEYTTSEEDYGDVMKLSHVAKKGDEEVDIDWSPYSKMKDDEFKLWLDLGMPTRKDVNSVGPLDMDDLKQLAMAKGVSNLDPKLAKAGM